MCKNIGYVITFKISNSRTIKLINRSNSHIADDTFISNLDMSLLTAPGIATVSLDSDADAVSVPLSTTSIEGSSYQNYAPAIDLNALVKRVLLSSNPHYGQHLVDEIVDFFIIVEISYTKNSHVQSLYALLTMLLPMKRLITMNH